jgi:hypothetical protein
MLGLVRILAVHPNNRIRANAVKALWTLGDTTESGRMLDEMLESADEMMRLRMARAARDGGFGPWRLRMHSRTGLVGVLFLRTFDRAERIYWAMAARGFDGRIRTPGEGAMRWTDRLFAAAALVAAAAVVAWDKLAYG